MRLLAILIAAFGFLLLAAQTGDLRGRLQNALQPTGQADSAAAALAAKDYAALKAMLSAAGPPDRADLLALRAAVEFLAGDLNRAVADFEAAARTAPLTENDRFTLAMALVTLNADDRARGILDALHTEHPRSALYLYWLGRIDYYQRRYGDAIQKLQAATTLDPESSRIWDGLGLAFDMQGDADHALPAFENANRLNRAAAHPSPWPPNDYGFLLLRLDKLAPAEQSLRESLRYDPSLAQTHYHLGRVLESQGKNGEAISEFQIAIAGDPESSDACYSLAQLYRKLHREAEAQSMFAEVRRRKAVSETPQTNRNVQP